MSADNGIYILQAKDGYRVVHAQAIENLWWWDDMHHGGKLNPKFIFDYFGNSQVFKTSQEALSYAQSLYDDIMDSGMSYIEYGIQSITGWEDKEFPTEGSDE